MVLQQIQTKENKYEVFISNKKLLFETRNNLMRGLSAMIMNEVSELRLPKSSEGKKSMKTRE